MKIKTPTDAKFKNYHSQLLKHLRLKGLQAKAVDAYECAIKRSFFKGHVENLIETEVQTQAHLFKTKTKFKTKE